jgi:hypothetical protein
LAFLADTWLMWLVLSGVTAGVMVFFRESRRGHSGAGFFTSSDEFSIKTILFGLKRGEGDLFLGFVGTMICFSLFLAGFIHWVTRLF